MALQVTIPAAENKFAVDFNNAYGKIASFMGDANEIQFMFFAFATEDARYNGSPVFSKEYSAPIADIDATEGEGIFNKLYNFIKANDPMFADGVNLD